MTALLMNVLSFSYWEEEEKEDNHSYVGDTIVHHPILVYSFPDIAGDSFIFVADNSSLSYVQLILMTVT